MGRSVAVAIGGWRAWLTRPRLLRVLTLAAPSLVVVAAGFGLVRLDASDRPHLALPVPRPEHVVVSPLPTVVTSGGAASKAPSTTANGAAGTAITMPTTARSIVTWTRLAAVDAGLEHPAGLASVAAAGGDLLAVGNAGSGALVVVSRDAHTWARVPEAERTFGRAVLRDVDIGDRAFVVGSTGGEPAAWVSADGRRWSRVAVDMPGPTRRGFLAAVATRPGGPTVAVGFTPGSVGIWMLDGGRFRPATVSGSGDVFADVVHTPDGFVAAGNDAEGRAVVWVSGDGDRWSPEPVAGDHRASIAALASATDVDVAVGYDNRGPRAWWRRRGATSWSPAMGPPSTASRPQTLLTATTLAGGVVAVGQGDGAPLCWSTRDGRQWAPCSPPPDADVVAVPQSSIAVGRDALLVLGGVEESQQETGIGVWLAESIR